MDDPKDLLVAALAQIETFPETWNQEEWRCETGFCLAGWMAELSTEVEWVGRQSSSSLTNGLHVSFWASGKLGIEAEEARQLFHVDNTLDDLRRGVKAYVNDEPIPVPLHEDPS